MFYKTLFMRLRRKMTTLLSIVSPTMTNFLSFYHTGCRSSHQIRLLTMIFFSLSCYSFYFMEGGVGLYIFLKILTVIVYICSLNHDGCQFSPVYVLSTIPILNSEIKIKYIWFYEKKIYHLYIFQATTVGHMNNLLSSFAARL